MCYYILLVGLNPEGIKNSNVLFSCCVWILINGLKVYHVDGL